MISVLFGTRSVMTFPQQSPRSTPCAQWCTIVRKYQIIHQAGPARMIEIERIQTGVRIEKHLLKVLKGLAELKDLSLGDLLEGIVLHAFEGKLPFSKETLGQIAELNKIYGMSLRAIDSHKLKEK
jgi:hypothetical protein